VANVLAVKDFTKEEQFIMFATAKGTVKKTALSAYGNIRQNGIIAIGLEEGDTLIDVAVTGGDDQILLGTRHGMAVRFKEGDVRAMGRPAAGVKGAELEEGDEVVSMIVVPASADPDKVMVLTGCVNGYGKRTLVSEYRLIKRGGKGVINIKTSERNGDVIGMQTVTDDDQVMFITEKGIMMRTRVAEIRETGRNAQGVKLLRLDDGDKLVAMACVNAEEADEETVAPPPDASGDGSPVADATPKPQLPDES
jgi:DNA gyrase subunit A